MPRATYNPTDSEEIWLKTLDDAFVRLRKLSYGEVLERRSFMKFAVSSDGKKNKGLEGEIAMANRKVQEFEFARCIVDHNLEDDNGRKLNLGNRADLDRLDPRVGQEIEQLISERNNFEPDEESEGNSATGSELS
jgi:hypothetical protein